MHLSRLTTFLNPKQRLLKNDICAVAYERKKLYLFFVFLVAAFLDEIYIWKVFLLSLKEKKFFRSNWQKTCMIYDIFGILWWFSYDVRMQENDECEGQGIWVSDVNQSHVIWRAQFKLCGMSRVKKYWKNIFQFNYVFEVFSFYSHNAVEIWLHSIVFIVFLMAYQINFQSLSSWHH